MKYKIREILIKNQKKKSREIFRAIHWSGHYSKIAVSKVRIKNVSVVPS